MLKKSTKNITFPPVHNRPLSTQIALKNKPFAGLAKRASPRCVAITPITSAAKHRTNHTNLATHHPPVGTNTTNAIRWTI